MPSPRRRPISSRAWRSLTDVVPSSDRDRLELSLQSALGAGADDDTGLRRAGGGARLHASARALGAGARRRRRPSRSSGDIHVLHITRGQLDSALEIAERIRTIADAGGDRLMRLQAHHRPVDRPSTSVATSRRRSSTSTREPLYDADADRMSALVYLHDARVTAMSVRSLLLWNFGRIDQALEVNRRSVEYARTLGHPVSFAYVLVHAGWLRALRREPEACATEGRAAIAYATEHELEYWIARGLLLRGWALAERSVLDDGIARHGARARGAHRARNAHRADDVPCAARLRRWRAGRFDDARALIERTKTLVASTAERHYEADPPPRRRAGRRRGRRRGRRTIRRLRTRDGAARKGHRVRHAPERRHARLARDDDARASPCSGTPGAQARARLATLLATFTEGLRHGGCSGRSAPQAAGRARTRRSAKAEEKPS